MPNITTCSKCGMLYVESSEERANEPDRTCGPCVGRYKLPPRFRFDTPPVPASVLLFKLPGDDGWTIIDSWNNLAPHPFPSQEQIDIAIAEFVMWWEMDHDECLNCGNHRETSCRCGWTGDLQELDEA